MTNFRTKTVVSSINLTQKEYDALQLTEEICTQVWLNACNDELEIDAYKAKKFIASLRNVATVVSEESEQQPDA